MKMQRNVADSKAALSHLIVGIIIVAVIVVAAVGGYILLSPPGSVVKYGTSSVSLNSSSASVAAGGSITDSYSVALASGTKWGTNVVISNSTALSSAGISVTDSAGMQDPPYMGTLTISVLSSTKPGTYYIPIGTTGDDPSSQNAMLTLTVTAQSATTVSSSSTTTTTSSTNTGTTSHCYGYYC
jgi:hypothetical protein